MPVAAIADIMRGRVEEKKHAEDMCLLFYASHGSRHWYWRFLRDRVMLNETVRHAAEGPLTIKNLKRAPGSGGLEGVVSPDKNGGERKNDPVRAVLLRFEWVLTRMTALLP